MNSTNVSNFNNGNKGFSRNGSMTNPRNVEKTMQKFQQLAKDAQSSGDPVLVENYLQHADHFSRVIETKNSENNQNRIKVVEEIHKPQNNQSSNIKPDQDKTEDKNN